MIKLIPVVSIFLKIAFGYEVRITSVSDFSKFVNKVNDRYSYSGTTVYLDSDFSFSKYLYLDPIGTHRYNFKGTFDGQGHIIYNLVISSSSLVYVGLFGYSERVTIRNVVLDSSCSMASSYSSSYALIGGIIGRCHSSYGDCLIENRVNMAKVAFNGDISDNLYIGEIAGYLDSPSSGYKCTVRNCANYGSIVHSGKCGNYDELGGIVGYSEGYSSYYNYVQNCLNYGTIEHSGTSDYPMLGGVVGVSYSYTKIQNCLSAGKITSSSSETSYVGSVVGYIDSDETHINYCYFTSDVDVDNLYGINSSSFPSSATGTPTSPTNADSGLIDTLITQAIDGGWNEWALNPNKKTVIFKVNYNKGFSISSQVILLPTIKMKEILDLRDGIQTVVAPKSTTQNQLI